MGVIEIYQSNDVGNEADAPSLVQEINKNSATDQADDLLKLEQDDTREPSASNELDDGAQSLDDPLVSQSDMVMPGFESSFSRLRGFERPDVFDALSPGTQMRRSWKPKGVIEIYQSIDVDNEADTPSSEQEIDKNSATDQSTDDVVLKLEQDDTRKSSASDGLDEDDQSLDDPLATQSDVVTPGLESSFSRFESSFSRFESSFSMLRAFERGHTIV
jgi:hypothetical protein